ncbi:MAG: histidine phosphatase family protein [Candidatus Harrisonbacteria bacterium]|nr:histidine phosphatase family protein [Candidatus Harrisonbacteria bacterium]
MKKTFVLVRHLTTSWNRRKLIQGQTDIELDEGGKQEARTLAKKLQPLGIGCIVSSDLKRASQTANIIAETLHVPVVLDKRLRECAFGTVEGLTRKQAVEQYGDKILGAWNEQYDSYDFCEYGGENRKQVLERHLSFLNDVPSMSSEKTVLLVGHGRGLNTLLASLGHPPTIKRSEYCIIEH